MSASAARLPARTQAILNQDKMFVLLVTMNMIARPQQAARCCATHRAAAPAALLLPLLLLRRFLLLRICSSSSPPPSHSFRIARTHSHAFALFAAAPTHCLPPAATRAPPKTSPPHSSLSAWPALKAS